MEQVTNRLAVYDLRDWWLSHPRMQELLVDTRDHKGTDLLNPFFPVAQQPEGGFPYIRYTVARDILPSQWWMHTEQVGLDLYMDDIAKSNEVLNTFISMAGREDKSARDLELWLDERDAQRAAAEEPSIPRPFTYHSISYVGGGDIGASDEEGGAHSRIMMFAIEYSPLAGEDIKS